MNNRSLKTRKGLLLTLFLVASTVFAPVYSQVGEARDMLSIGFNGGLNTSSIQFNPTIKQQLNPGITGGVTLRYNSEKYFWIICAAQVECNISQRGWKELIEDGSGNEYSRLINYVEVPFMAHLGFGREMHGVQGFMNIGPQIGFYLNDSEAYGGTTPWDITARPNGVTEQYGKTIENKIDYGITGGLGLELRTGLGAFGIEGRYYFGLSDIFDNSKVDYFGRSANNVISLRVHYLFTLWNR
jgi:hypothetical protein